MSLTQMTLTQLAEGLSHGRFSSEELTRAYLARIGELDGDIHSYLYINEEGALREARASDLRRTKGECLGVLDGVPYSLKDNICVKGMLTTCSSRMLENYRPPYDATIYTRLAEQGAVLLGKTNLDEFAMGGSTETSAFGTTRNPLDLTRSPGGSSGGSAASVAASLCAYSIGTDTGGSIRQPAAFCGIVSVKPTYGAISRYGMIAMASSMDQAGVLSKTVKDNALVTDLLLGADPHDGTCVAHPEQGRMLSCKREARSLRIAVPFSMTEQFSSPDVCRQVLRAARALEAEGATLVDVTLPQLSGALATYHMLSACEASSNLARFDGVRYGHRASEYGSLEELICRSRTEGFGGEVKRRILLGTLALSSGFSEEYYRRALRVRGSVRMDLLSILEGCDLILCPTTPSVATVLGQHCDDPAEHYGGDAWTAIANLAGLPALSVPFGTGENGLPVGVQLMGAPFTESLLYRVGELLEVLR